MRYRPFGGAGAVVSAVSLRVPTDPGLVADDCVALIHAALEQGINYFEVPAAEPEVLFAVGEALAPVERNLFSVALRVGGRPGDERHQRDFSAPTLATEITDALARTGFTQFDAAVLDDPASEELSPQALATMKQARSTGRVKMIGVSGVDEAIDAYISIGAFDMLALPFNLASGWRERRRLNAAQSRDMAVVGYDPWPEQFHGRAAQEEQGGGFLSRAFKPKQQDVLAGAGTYAFLDQTPGWTSEQICLAYALTDVKIATVMVEPRSLEHLEMLASVADRDMPAGLSAQVEMARFSKGAKESA